MNFPLTFYVAGPSATPERYEKAVAKLEELGLVNTFDWLAEIRAVGSANPLDPAQNRASSTKDLLAAGRANIYWLLEPSANPTAPGYGSTGAWVELGARLWARRLHSLPGSALEITVTSCERVDYKGRRSIFTALAEECGTDEEAFLYIARRVSAHLGAAQR